MYEIRLTGPARQRFIAVAKERMKEKKMKMGDLAKQLDRPINSVYNFFSNANRPNRFIAAEIAEFLEIKPEDWR